MATVLDIGILGNLAIVFIFLLIFVAGYGLLAFVNPFKFDDDRKQMYAIMAFALAFIVVLSRPVLGVIAFSIPWFTVLLFVAFFMLFFAKMFDPELDTKSLIGESVVYGFLIFFVAVILLFGFGATFGQTLLEQQPGVSDADVITGEGTPADTFVPVDEVQEDTRSDEGSVRAATGGSADNNVAQNIVLTLFHPKILGMLFMLVLATITILLIAK